MLSRSKLKPGQKGTKKLTELYGEKLVCVRYRYDEQRQMRFKTAEIIVEATRWIPKPKPSTPPRVVLVRVAYGEVDLGRQVRNAGEKWIAKRKLWEIPYEQVVALKLENRIVEDVSNTTDRKSVV